VTPATRFVVPPGRLATRPPEHRGLDRDGVRLLVATPGSIRHLTFRELPEVLEPGDLVVVNTSATLPAAVDASRADGTSVVVHHAGALDDGSWVVELRRRDGHGPLLDGRPGEVVTWTSGTRVRLITPYTPPGRRLWRARIGLDGPVEDELARVGRPIGYGYLDGRFGLDAYQPVFGRHPGSAEMASAGRPFSDAMVTALVTRGIGVAPVLLHTGVSSPEVDEPPQPERFRVPTVTARAVERTRADGGRIVAVGTTVTRALESVVRPDGGVEAGGGWTDLVLGPDRPARVVDGLVTGWHEPQASHLLLLEAVAGAELVGAAYAAAVAGDYLWHEFGDSCLLLP
jgi:S-adenosylmethionine:tRNA ribosyltransferase-isomerase